MVVVGSAALLLLVASRAVTRFWGIAVLVVVFVVLVYCLCHWTLRSNPARRWAFLLVASAMLGMGFLWRGEVFGVGVYHLVSHSMAPAVREHSLILVDQWLPEGSQPIIRCDIIAFRHQGTVQLKRVVGLPGDRISTPGHRLRIEGSKPSCFPNSSEIYTLGIAQKVPYEHFFVIGDNSRVSVDSRRYGPIPRRNLIGVLSDTTLVFKDFWE